MATEIYVNLAVADLDRARAFYEHLGFDVEPRFSNDEGTAIILGPGMYVMLMTPTFFRSFTDRQICDTEVSVEALTAIRLESRQAVEALVARAREAGGSVPRPPQDLDFMFSRAVLDPDGHHWDFFCFNGEETEDA